MGTTQSSAGKAPSRRKKRAAFLEAYVECWNVSRAARKAQVSRQQHYEWMKGAEYAKAFAEACKKAEEFYVAETERRIAEWAKERGRRV